MPGRGRWRVLCCGRSASAPIRMPAGSIAASTLPQPQAPASSRPRPEPCPSPGPCRAAARRSRSGRPTAIRSRWSTSARSPLGARLRCRKGISSQASGRAATRRCRFPTCTSGCALPPSPRGTSTRSCSSRPRPCFHRSPAASPHPRLHRNLPRSPSRRPLPSLVPLRPRLRRPVGPRRRPTLSGFLRVGSSTSVRCRRSRSSRCAPGRRRRRGGFPPAAPPPFGTARRPTPAPRSSARPRRWFLGRSSRRPRPPRGNPRLPSWSKRRRGGRVGLTSEPTRLTGRGRCFAHPTPCREGARRAGLVRRCRCPRLPSAQPSSRSSP